MNGEGMAPKLFENVKIVDFGWAVVGPTTIKYFADQGAEVIKVEPPPFGEAFRLFILYDKPTFPLFSILNRGKKSISLDLRKEKAKEIFKRLVEKSDVLIENFVQGTMEK